MAVYAFLQAIQDQRKGSNEASFNGYLEDYLDTLESDHKNYDLFSQLFEINNDLRILVGYRSSINSTTISNQIIRYKDVFKLKDKPLVCPYIIYAANGDNEKAILLTDEEFIYVKGLYYTLTEPNGPLYEVKNEMIAMDTSDIQLVYNVTERLFTERAGSLQREIDRKHFTNYDFAKEKALELSNDLFNNSIELISNTPKEEKEGLINSIIVKWFLLKKYLYVQYMINKDILVKIHEGNVKKQRNQAKINSDEIKFISLSDLWRHNNQ